MKAPSKLHALIPEFPSVGWTLGKEAWFLSSGAELEKLQGGSRTLEADNSKLAIFAIL